MIKILTNLDALNKKYTLSKNKAIISVLIYFLLMVFGAVFLLSAIDDNDDYFQKYSETDNIIQTLHVKNGIGLVEKIEFNNSIYKDPDVDIYTFTIAEEGEEPDESLLFLNDYLLITSAAAFTPSQTEKINEAFMKSIFTDEKLYNNDYRVYRYLPKTLKDNEVKLNELFSHFNIENPVFEYSIEESRDLNGLGNSLLNFVLFTIIIIGLILVMYNVLEADILRSSFGKVISQSLITLALLYVFGFLGNIISIVLSALFKERVLTSVNQLSIVETLHSGQAVMMIISVVLLGPIVEELIFRKSLFSLFENKKLAIIISSLIFGLIHLIAEPSLASVIINLPAYLIPGLVFGYFYAKNDENILVPTVAHILSNLISVLLIYAI